MEALKRKNMNWKGMSRKNQRAKPNMNRKKKSKTMKKNTERRITR